MYKVFDNDWHYKGRFSSYGEAYSYLMSKGRLDWYIIKPR